MGNQQSEAVHYYPENSFRVFVDGVLAGEFSKVGPLLKGKVDSLQIRGGGSTTPVANEPGNATFEPLTLERGASENRILGNWFDEIVNSGGVTGNNAPTVKKQVRVEQLDRDKTTVLVKWTYSQAWLAEYDEGSFDADSGKFRMETVKLEYLGKPERKEGE